MTNEKIVAAVDQAADAAGTVGATARMVSDHTGWPHGEVVTALARLEHAGLLGGETPLCAPRWYSVPETPEERRRAEAEWDELT